MAGGLTIYSIYQLQHRGIYYLLRTEQPAYANASQTQEDMACQAEQARRESMLDSIAKQHGVNKDGFTFIGEMQSYPVGAELYAESGNTALDVYFMETAFGYPWIILGTAASETEFLTALHDDEDLPALQPVGKPKQIPAIFLTENDMDL